MWDDWWFLFTTAVMDIHNCLCLFSGLQRLGGTLYSRRILDVWEVSCDLVCSRVIRWKSRVLLPYSFIRVYFRHCFFVTIRWDNGTKYWSCGWRGGEFGQNSILTLLHMNDYTSLCLYTHYRYIHSLIAIEYVLVTDTVMLMCPLLTVFVGLKSRFSHFVKEKTEVMSKMTHSITSYYCLSVRFCFVFLKQCLHCRGQI